MQDVKTIKNVKPEQKGSSKTNIFSIFFKAKQKNKKRVDEKNQKEWTKNLGSSMKCECGRHYGLNGGTMRKNKTNRTDYICQICYEKELKLQEVIKK